MPESIKIELPDEQATVVLGERLSSQHGLIFLHGELGAGKTTLVRGFLRALGYDGPVKSPTYTLVEPYDLGEDKVFHLDIYRLGDPEEIHYLGIRDELERGYTLLVEWPERAEGELGNPELEIRLDYLGEARSVTLIAHSQSAQQLLEVISQG